MIWLIPFGVLLIAVAYIFTRFAVDISASLRQDGAPARQPAREEKQRPSISSIAFAVAGIAFIVAGTIGALLGR
jgi:uncharacterized membrane protein SpoIIM required for sporulation